MDASDLAQVLDWEQHPEAVVIRFRIRRLEGSEQLGVIKAALFQQAEVSSDRLILDLSSVEFFSSPALNLMVSLRQRMLRRGIFVVPPYTPPRKAWPVFCRDNAAALQAICEG